MSTSGIIENIDVLKRCPLFFGLENREIGELLDGLGAEIRTCDRRECILTEGQPAGTMGVVLCGSVQVAQTDFFGGRSVLSVLGPSELFGAVSACAGTAAIPAEVTACGSARVLLLEWDRLAAAPYAGQVLCNLARLLAEENLAFRSHSQVTSRRTTREKLLAYLDQQAREQGSACFDIPLDRQGLADYLEVERSGLSAEIGKLSREGVLHSRRSHFELLKKPE